MKNLFMKNSTRLALIILVIFSILYIVTSGNAMMYTVTSGTVGVLVTFGKYSEEVQTAGLHIKVPLLQNVKIIDVKLQTANYLGSEDAGDSEGVINKPYIEVLDNKNLPIGIELTVQFTPLAEQAHHILTFYGENYFEKLINPFIRNIVRNVVGKYQAEEIASRRAEIETEIKVQLEKEFQDIPFRLNNVGLRKINLPDIILNKIKEVQLAKQEEQRLGMVEQQAKKNQQIKTIEANTRLIEITTQAKADAEKKRIEADAAAYQITAEAKANAEANKLIAQSITQELIEYRSIERWDGSYPQTLMGNNDKGGLILSLPRSSDSPPPPPVPH